MLLRGFAAIGLLAATSGTAISAEVPLPPQRPGAAASAAAPTPPPVRPTDLMRNEAPATAPTATEAAVPQEAEPDAEREKDDAAEADAASDASAADKSDTAAKTKPAPREDGSAASDEEVTKPIPPTGAPVVSTKRSVLPPEKPATPARPGEKGAAATKEASAKDAPKPGNATAKDAADEEAGTAAAERHAAAIGDADTSTEEARRANQFMALPPSEATVSETGTGSAASLSGAAIVPVPPTKPAPPVRTAMVTAPSSGALICNDPRLTGKPKVSVVGHITGCVIGRPVEITAVSGIRLSTPATLDCHTARTFANWLTGVAVPAAKKVLGRRITGVWVMGSYSCRTRNNRRGARLSEHAGGRAIDIGGVTLGDGRKVRVLQDWGKGNKGTFLRRIWKQACGPFKTVLGPDGDRFHQDHLHFDTARRRSTFCR